MPELKPSKRIYQFYADPGHAWLRVPIKELKALGLLPKISHYSYINERYMYLEEDLDAGTFIEEMKTRGIEVRMNGHHTNGCSRIRSYPLYSNPNYISPFEKSA